MKTQQQLFEDARNRNAEINKSFLFFANDGLTQEELRTNIKRRPELWGRFEHWIDKLPKEKDD